MVLEPVKTPIAVTMKPNSLTINIASNGIFGGASAVSGAAAMTRASNIRPSTVAINEKGNFCMMIVNWFPVLDTIINWN